MSLAEVQCHLDKEGASDLVIDLIMNTTSDRVFQESILLAIALLEGGNTTIQVSIKNPSPQVHHPLRQYMICQSSEDRLPRFSLLVDLPYNAMVL